MEKHSLLRALSLALTIITAIALSSCRTQYVAMPEVHQRDSLHVSSDHRYDSIYIDRTHTIIQRGDTIFKTDSIYVEKFTDVEVHDTVTVTQRDTITVPVPVEPPPRSPLALSERVRVLGKGCLIGGIGALLLALVAYIAIRFYLHR